MKADQVSEYFCILPWVHISLGTTGVVHTCCRSSSKEGMGNFSDSKLIEIWNSQNFRNIRLDMLAGNKIEACNDCYQQEDKGVASLREISNSEFASTIGTVKKTNIDGSLNDFNPLFIDLRFSNICNFKCRTCSADFSTSWYSDYSAFGINNLLPDFINSTKSEELWSELLLILPRVKKIYFAGGEPLLHLDHYRLLNELLKLGLTDVELIYNTNLSVLKFGNNSVLEVWSQFSKITICASMDGIEKKGEFIRNGFNWNVFINNKNEVEEKIPHVNFKIYWTASVLNSFHLIEVFKFIIEKKFLKDGNDFEINILNEPKIYNIKVLNKFEREKLTRLYCEFINIYLKDNVFIGAENFIKILNYVILYLNEGEFINERVKLWALSRRLDKLRNEKSELLFPELRDIFNQPFATEN